jgi:hypothetical protein
MIPARDVSSTGMGTAGISPAGDADPAGMNAAAVKASGPGAAAPTRGRVIRDQAGDDYDDCCQGSEGTTNHGLPPVDWGVVHSGSDPGAPAAIRTRRHLLTFA